MVSSIASFTKVLAVCGKIKKHNITFFILSILMPHRFSAFSAWFQLVKLGVCPVFIYFKYKTKKKSYDKWPQEYMDQSGQPLKQSIVQ